MTADRPPVSGEPPEPVYLYWSEYDDSATVKGWGGDNLYRCRECPEWQGDRDSAPRHSRLHAEASTGAALDFDSANALLSAYNYWVNEHPDATVGDRYDWTKRYLARLAEQEGEGR